MKRVSTLKKLVLGALLASTMGLSFSGSAAAATRAEVKRMVVEEAANSRVPAALALAVAKIESDFNDRALSSAGARGVMQIMPKTASGVFGVRKDELWDARLNIQLGLDYLEQLYMQYGKRWDLALSHYNGGTLKGGKGAKARPHSYTRKYVANVLRWEDRFEGRFEGQATAVASADMGNDLDNVRRILVRELEDREFEGRNSAWREARNDRPQRAHRPWRKTRQSERGATDFDDTNFTERLNRARTSLDDFTASTASNAIVRWTDG